MQNVAVQRSKICGILQLLYLKKPLKVGVTIPLFKKEDKIGRNTYRGVCLLPILSRVLWAEEMNLLDENQAGFRKGRSTADATRILKRIQGDSIILQTALDEQSQPRVSNHTLIC